MNLMNDGIRIRTSQNTHEVVARLLYQDSTMKTVLDLPCGEGAFTKRLLDKGGLDVYAGDCVDALAVKGASFQVCDMNQPLPYEDAQFDAVACIDGIEHAERPFDFIKECSRVLRVGGSLVISTPNIGALRSRWRWFLTGFHNKGKRPLDETRPSPLHHISMVELPLLRYMLHTNGFELECLAANRVKPVSWLYLPWVPLVYLVTLFVFYREEKNPDQRKRNRTIFRQMLSRSVLFGETLVVKAVRINSAEG